MLQEITLQCANCGSEDAKMPIGKRKKFYERYLSSADMAIG